MFGLCFVVHYFVSFLLLQLSRSEREKWLLYFSCLLCHLTVSVLCLFLIVLRVGLQCLVVSFSGHIHLLFHVYLLSSTIKINIVSTISWVML